MKRSAASSPANPTARACSSAPASTATSRETRAAVDATRRGDRHGRDPPHQHRPERRTSRACSMRCRRRSSRSCRTPPAATARDDAVRTLRLARELLDGHDLVKLEVLGDPHTLYPEHARDAQAAAKTLVDDGFKVMVYSSDDPIIAKQLEEIGCVAVMPLASLIGSGMGILNPVEPAAHHREREGAGAGRCRRRHRIGRRDRDGARLRRRADEHGDRRGAATRCDGARDEEGGRGRARGLPRRPHAEEALLRGAELAHRRKDRSRRRLEPADPQLRPAPGPTSPAQKRALDDAAARSTASRFPQPERSLRPQRAARARDRLRHGRNHGGRSPRRIPETDFSPSRSTGPGVGSLLNAIEREQLANLRVIRHDAVDVLEHMIADGTLGGDPSLLSRSVAEEAPPQAPPGAAGVRRAGGEKLKDGGILHAATDWPDYAEHMNEVFSEEPLLEPAADGFTSRPVTKFESRGQRLGHPIRELVFRRAGKAPAAR